MLCEGGDGGSMKREEPRNRGCSINDLRPDLGRLWSRTHAEAHTGQCPVLPGRARLTTSPDPNPRTMPHSTEGSKTPL